MTDDNIETVEDAASAAERLAEEIRRLRTEANLSQADLAGMIGYSPAYVSLAERPRKGLPSPAVVHAIDDALDASGSLIALSDQARAEHHVRRHSGAVPPPVPTEQTHVLVPVPVGGPMLLLPANLTGESIDNDQEGEDDTKRRDASKLIGLAIAASAQPALDAVDRLVPGRGHDRVDRKTVLGHEEIAQAFAGLYRSADPRAVLPAATTYADSALALLDAPMGDSERTALGGIVAGIHAQIGLWACHLHRPAMAYRYLATACQIADGVADPALQARTIGAFSYTFSSAPRGGHGGDPRRAVSSLTKALALAHRADGFTVGWLATWRADQYATLGDIDSAQRDIELADHRLTTTEDSTSTGFFARSAYGYGMQEHCDSVQAFTSALAGRTDEADRTFSQVQSRAANMRRRIATYGHMALAQVRAHEPDKACATLSQAVNLAVDNHYVMGLERAVGVRAGFDSAWSNLSCVRALDDQLHQPLA